MAVDRDGDREGESRAWQVEEDRSDEAKSALKRRRSGSMHLICPQCSAPSLAIVESIELPPDASSDEIALQIVACSRCGRRAAAVYEESRRGSDPAAHHTWYDLEDAELVRIAALIHACPTPARRNCECAAHRDLGAQGADGAWSLAAVAALASPPGKPIRYQA